MKKFVLLLSAAALLMTACEPEKIEPHNGNEGPSAPAQTYPATAVVIHNAVTDIDGNVYDAVKIGNQVWMASNLRTTRYANGEPIPEGGEDSSLSSPYRYKQGDNFDIYGYLYNWPAVMHGASSSNDNPSGVQGICPNGWHMPSDSEWTQLTDYCSSQSECVCDGSDINIAKSLASDHDWKPGDFDCAVGNDMSLNNATGFSAVPAGCYTDAYYALGNGTYFWSSTVDCPTKSVYRNIMYALPKVSRGCGSRASGMSVRCVRN